MLALDPDATGFDIVDCDLLPVMRLDEVQFHKGGLANQMLKSWHGLG